jgi:hypothetical protein
MVARKTHRRTAAASASKLPDDGIVVATSLLALSTLVLMLCASLA